MNNNLKRIEKELRSFVKRCKDIKYNTADIDNRYEEVIQGSES